MPAARAGHLRHRPRIAEVQSTIDMADVLIPGFLAFHPIGARLGQECVRMTGGDFRSMIFPTQYNVPSYNQWLLHEADLASAYRWHRRYLQHLQSQGVGGSGCSSRRPTCGISTRSPLNTPTRSSCRRIATR